MGLLDDAIREHLELKRRRGADPGEIEREESEALGPARREAIDDAPLEPVDPEPARSYVGHEPPALDEPADAYDDEPDFPLAEPPATHDAPYAEPEEASATPPHGDPLAHQPTREFSATELGDALGHDAAPPPPPASAPVDDERESVEANPEDELEETPDFLQETPEHDRLWFEQKPPKDFDF